MHSSWSRTIAISLVILMAFSTIVIISPDVEAAAPTITNYGRTPARIDAGGMFLFWLTYTSDENNPPTYVRVTRSLPNSVIKTMVENDSGDTTYTDGKQYFYEWYFYDALASAIVFTLRVKDAVYPEVTKILVGTAWPFPYLSNQAVTPVSDVEGNYSFSLTYYSLINQAPSKVQIVLDGVWHDMTKNDSGDTNYFNGCNYRWNTTSPLTSGIHVYQFYCTDSTSTNSNYTAGFLLLTIADEYDTVRLSFSFLALIAFIGALVGMFFMIVIRR